MKEALEPNRLLENYLMKLEAHALFTDGSKSLNNSVGSACIYPDEIRYSGRSVSKTACLYSWMYRDLWGYDVDKWERIWQICNLIWFVKCSLSLKSVNTCIKSNYYTLEIKKMYEITARYPEKSIKFTWILSHIGIEYNQGVDSLANTYANSPIFKPSIIPFRDHHQEFKKYYFLKTTQFMINQRNFKGKNYS